MIRFASKPPLLKCFPVNGGRCLATVAPASRKPKAEGSIAGVFSSLSGELSQPLPARFSDLKKELFTDALVESWREVLEELEDAVEKVATKGSEVRVSLNSSV